MRRRNIKNAEEKLRNYPLLFVSDYQAHQGSWQNMFAQNQPIYLEVGMGKGNFIIEQAKRNPNKNYIGIEKFAGVILQAVPKINELDHPLTNLKLICADATNLTTLFGKNEITGIYLNFSDPWPKNRHDKRRLTHENFLKQYEEILIKDGIIEFKTDNMALFTYSLISFNQARWQFLDLSLDLHGKDSLYKEEDIIKTEYEERFMNLGNQIYYLKVKK